VALGTRQQPAASLVVVIDHGATQFRPREQTRLGGLVGSEGAVIVEVVLSEIREHGDLKRRAVHPPLMQRMRRHFHRDRLRTRIAQLRETALQLRRVRRRETGMHEVARQAGAQRADNRAARAERGERRGNPLAR
jgi:hypothetical protein